MAENSVFAENALLTDLHPNDWNPNRLSDEKFELLLRSIEEDGFTEPILVNQDGLIIDGEHRWRAAGLLGYTSIPVIRVDMTPEEARIATLRHNKARGSHDADLEEDLLIDIIAMGGADWVADSLMLDVGDVADMLPPDIGDIELGDLDLGDIGDLSMGALSIEVEGTSLSRVSLDTEQANDVSFEVSLSPLPLQSIEQRGETLRLLLEYTGGDGMIIAAALGSPTHLPTRLLQLCRRNL